jgi:hypothetical protein
MTSIPAGGSSALVCAESGFFSGARGRAEMRSISLLEQVRADCRALGIDADRWRLSDRLFGTHPPVEVRIRALSRSPERSLPARGLSSHALAQAQSPRSDPAAESHSA